MLSRRLSLMILTTALGGGWFYFGGKLPTNQGSLNQPGVQNSVQSAAATASNYIASLPIFKGGSTPPPPSTVPLQGGPTIRIASYNIQVFGDEKARNRDVMQTLAMIIRNFHVIAIQEIRTQDLYFLDNFLRNYVNADGRHYYDYVIGPRLGRSNSKEQYAFIFDSTAVEINRQSVYTINDPEDLLHREPLVAMFRTRGPAPQDAFTFMLVNIHTDPDETKEELDTMADVYHAVRQSSGGEDDIILIGDFNVDDQHLGRLGQIPGVRPILSRIPTNTRQNNMMDNIIVHQPSTGEFTGRWGVFDIRPLYNPPLTLEQALLVSDHLPIWAEFSSYEAATPGRVAARAVAPAPAAVR